MRVTLTLLLIALALGGCATPTPVATSYPGEDAAAIAGRIDGCADVLAEAVAPSAVNLESTATCTLDGHQVGVYSWVNAKSADLRALYESTGGEHYYATGVAWTVSLVDDSASADAEQKMADAVVESLGGEVVHVGG